MTFLFVTIRGAVFFAKNEHSGIELVARPIADSDCLYFIVSPMALDRSSLSPNEYTFCYEGGQLQNHLHPCIWLSCVVQGWNVDHDSCYFHFWSGTLFGCGLVSQAGQSRVVWADGYDDCTGPFCRFDLKIGQQSRLAQWFHEIQFSMHCDGPSWLVPNYGFCRCFGQTHCSTLGWPCWKKTN